MAKKSLPKCICYVTASMLGHGSLSGHFLKQFAAMDKFVMLSANSCSGIRLLTVAHSILLCIVYEDNVA